MDEKSQREAEMYQDVGGGRHGDRDKTSWRRAEASSISTAKTKYYKLKTEQFSLYSYMQYNSKENTDLRPKPLMSLSDLPVITIWILRIKVRIL